MPSAPARKSVPQARPRQSSLLKAVIASLAGFTAVGAIAALAAVIGSRTERPAAPPPPAASSSASSERTTSIIIASPNRDDCQRYEFDNVTGGIQENGVGECGKSSGGRGTRVQAISKGFRTH